MKSYFAGDSINQLVPIVHLEPSYFQMLSDQLLRCRELFTVRSGTFVRWLCMIRQQSGLIVDVQATNVRKDQTITQLTSRLTKMERDLKSAQTRFQEEKKLLTSREEELLKAKAEVTSSLHCNRTRQVLYASMSCMYILVLYVCLPMLYVMLSFILYYEMVIHCLQNAWLYLLTAI